MAAAGLRIRATFAGLLAAAVLGGCGDPNAGDAFAEEFSTFLDSQDAVVGHVSGGRNDLPFSGSASTSVTLDPALDVPGVVDVAAAIVTHRTKRDVTGHDLTIAFTPDGAKDASATTSFYLQVAKPLPDSQATRTRLTSLVEHAQAYVGADDGIVTVASESDAVRVETTSDPTATAAAIREVLVAGEPRKRPQGEEWPDLELRGGEDLVVVEDGGDIAWLDDLRGFVKAARAVPDFSSIYVRASGDPRDSGRSLLVKLASDAPDSAVAALQRQIPVSEAEITVSKELPPTASPSSTAAEPTDDVGTAP